MHAPILQILFPEFEIDINNIDGKAKQDPNFHKNDMHEMQVLTEMEASGKAGSLQSLPESELERYAQRSDEIDDKYFEKFRKECEVSPLQIIRYKRNGEILWISEPKMTLRAQLASVPLCELCGEKRAFEFQIMPQMLNYLKDSSVDWGVIAVFTCPKSCPLPKEKGYVKEFCIKQDIVK